MADTLESLEIEIKHSASGAADQIKAVASAIRSVGSALEKTLPQFKVFSTMMSSGSFGVTNNITSQTADTINNVNQVAGRAGRATKEAAKGVRELSKEAAKSKTPLNTLIDRLKRIAFYRIIRGIIKAIGKAFSEGLQYAYAFSDGISTSGHRFAEAMDTLKSSSTQMKAQLGSAFISLLAAITPIITAIINLITKLAVALSQLFAAFTGGTYLKAAEVSDKFADDMKRGAGGAKEWRNQLLGFDEINRLNEPSGGGGGGSSGLDPADMFEDTKIDGIFAKIAAKWEEFKASLDFEPIKKSFAKLGEAAKKLGDTILRGLGWVWDNILAPLGKWIVEEAAPASVELLAEAFDLLRNVLELVSPVFQWLWDNILKPLAQWTGEAFIKALHTVTDILHDLNDFLSGNTTFDEFVQNVAEDVAWIGEVIQESWSKIKAWLEQTWEDIKAKAKEKWDGVVEWFTTTFERVVQWFSELPGKLGYWAGHAVGTVVKFFMELPGKVGEWLQRTIEKIGNFASEAIKKIQEKFPEIIAKFIAFFLTLPAKLQEIGKNIVEGLWDGISNRWNTFIAHISEFVAGLIRGFKDALGIASPSTVFADIGNDVVQGLWNGISNMWGSFESWFSGIFGNLISWCASAHDWLQNVLTGVGLVGGAMGGVMSGSAWQGGGGFSGRAGHFANGGYPEEGELFIARENGAGAEMVGTIGGRTAVASNDDILNGIRQGVFEAVSAAMSNGNNSNGTEFKLFLDSREIKFGLERLDRAWGA